MNDQDKIAEQAAEIANLNLVLAERKAKIAELMGEAARAALPVGIVARDLMPKRTAFIAWCEWRGLETVEDQDVWGKRKFKHSHIEALWEGWFNAPDGGRSEALVLLLEILRCKRVIGNGDNADHRQALNDFNTAIEAAQAMADSADRIASPAPAAPSVPPVTLGHGWVHDGDAAFNPATGERRPYDFPPAAPERALCSKCCGEGVIHTGIDESPTTQCGKCEGTGLAISASTPAAPIDRDSILEEAALECENGCLPGETPDPVDASYNMAMHHAAHTIRSLKGSAAPLTVPLSAEHGAPKLTLRNGTWWPEGCVTDPDGRIIAPAGRHTDFKFGYDQGYADGLVAIRDSVKAIESSALASVVAVLHYPGCWDTAAYPALSDALSAVYDHFKCSECAAPEASIGDKQ